MKINKLTYILVLGTMVAVLSGCGQAKKQNLNSQGTDAKVEVNDANSSQTDNDQTDGTEEKQELEVKFGANGKTFTMHLYDNDTAKAIAHHVGSSDWRLPIYDYDNFENWEVMQYYDVPSRYEIPSNAEQITNEAAGTVYYSEPNRIVLFYQDAQVSGEYTPVGYFDYSEEFYNAVNDNPVLEGWGNKIIIISDGE